MRTLTGLILSGLSLSLAVTVAAADNFEGLVHFKNTAGGKTHEFDYLVKGTKSRIEPNAEAGEKTNVIFDADAKKMFVVMPNRKMVMEMETDHSRSDQPTAGIPQKSVEMIRTGKTDTVLGHPCEVIVAKSEGRETEICGAKGIGFFSGGHSMGRPGMSRSSDDAPAWTKELREQGFFPLRVVTKDGEGHEIQRMDATKIEKKVLDAGLFVPPTDYHKMNMSGMMPQGGTPGPKGKADLEQMMRGMRERQSESGGPPGGPGGVDIEKMLRERGGKGPGE
jgi:hypothetical protein